MTSRRLSLLVKPHGRESADLYETILRRVAPEGTYRVADGEGLWPLLAASDLAVIMASTAGLEALLFGLPLGVLQLPNGEYAFDYVSAGAAEPIPSDGEVRAWLQRLLEPNMDMAPRARDFLAANLAAVGDSARRVESLILDRNELHGRR